MAIHIETERVILRDMDPEKDFEPYCELMADADSVRYIGNVVFGPMLAWRQIATIIGHQAIRGYSFYSVIEKASGAWVGRVGHWNPHGWYAPEVGWAIHPAHIRKGFATEAAAACIAHAFDTLGWNRVIHMIHHENVASIKTAEKLGSRKIDTVKGIAEITDDTCFVYGQDRPTR